MSRRLRIHGVPEHFNLPWRLAIDEGRFAAAGFAVEWHDEPGGTGALTAQLADGSADLATVLTEGIVAAVGAGLAARIVAPWTSTPLLWGVHVAAGSSLHGIEGLDTARFAISRRGSGSHLMATLLADDAGFALRDDQLVAVGDIDGARRALGDGAADYFLWERFMTAPLVDSGELRRVDVLPTPWPGFVVAAGDAILTEDALAVRRVTAIAAGRAVELHADPGSARLIANRYGLTPDDAAEWLTVTTWAPARPVVPGLLAEVQDRLLAAGMIERAAAHAELAHG